MHKLSVDQKESLLKNKNVEKITDMHVVFTSTFKLIAIEDYLKGKSPDLIFQGNGIEPSWFIKDYCRSLVKKWKKKYFKEGKKSFFEEKRGKGSIGRPRKTNLDELTYEELQALVDIQHEVIESLKKKRALVKGK